MSEDYFANRKLVHANFENDIFCFEDEIDGSLALDYIKAISNRIEQLRVANPDIVEIHVDTEEGNGIQWVFYGRRWETEEEYEERKKLEEEREQVRREQDKQCKQDKRQLLVKLAKELGAEVTFK